MLLAVAVPVAAITNGDLDGEDHPFVVLVVADVGDGGWRCSGTLLTPTVVLTAGHCVSNLPDTTPIDAMRVFTESDVDNGDNSYPEAGNNSVEAVEWYPHPSYEIDGPWFMFDVGVVILAEPILLGEYGELPELDELDAYKTMRGKNKLTFTSVGYGLQQINPVFVQADRVRMVAYPKLIQMNAPGYTGDFSLLLSNNHSTGGTCFGDSGGPNFIGDSNVVGGVTSFGMNGNCAGTGGVFRMDRANALDFVNGFLP
jgi:secreted trypsin-like serine protease